MRTRQLSAKIRTDQEKNVKLCHVWSGSDEQLLRETKNGHTRLLWSLVATLPQTPNTRLHRCCATAPSSVSCSLRLIHNIYGAIISVFTTKMSEYNCNPTDSWWALHPENNNKHGNHTLRESFSHNMNVWVNVFSTEASGFLFYLQSPHYLQAAFTAPDSQETQSMYFKAGSPWMKPVYAFKYRLLPAV